MKNLYFFILALFVSIFSEAQPVITSNVLPVVGDTILMSFDSTLVSPGVSGANVYWDFSTSLHQDIYFARIYLNPINTPYGSTFSNSKLCRTDGIGSAYSYWDNTNSSKSVCYGFVEPNYYTQHYNNLPLSYYKFPISYGNSYIDSVSAITNPGNISGSGKYSFNADAWGTIKLPNKTVSNVLRTKSVLYIGDSSAGVNSYSLTTEYAWYQISKKEPLLVISSVIINHALYKKYILYDNNSATEINDNEESESLIIFPNPVKNTLFINSSVFNSACEISIHDIDGKILFSQSFISLTDEKSIDIGFLSKGLYILKYSDGKYNFRKKFIKM